MTQESVPYIEMFNSSLGVKPIF